MIEKINGKTVIQGQVLVLDPVNEGDLVTLTVVASDPDEETVSISYTSPFDLQGKWQTDYDSAGTHNFQVKASDGTDTTVQDVRITVNNVNRAPEVTLTLSKQTVAPNETISITIEATDKDGDGMTYILKKDNNTLSEGSITNKYTTQTSFSSIGDHTISVSVKDSNGATTTQQADIDGKTDIGIYNNANKMMVAPSRWPYPLAQDLPSQATGENSATPHMSGFLYRRL